MHLVKPMEFDREESDNTPSGDHRSAEDTREGVLGDGISQLKRLFFVFLPKGQYKANAISSGMQM